MGFKEFFKQKIIGFSLLIFALLTIEIFLMIYNFKFFIKLYIPIIILIVYFIGIFIEYFSKKRFYEKLNNLLEELEKKYLITEIIKAPDFVEGKLLKEVLDEVDKSMLENVNKYKYLQEEYKEYIELWIHEIKLPITTSKMIIENNKNEVTKSIDEELNKIENYIEQALFYARSTNVEKDYFIKKNNLREIVNECIKKNKNILIQEKAIIDLHNLDFYIETDSKWIIFILNQVVQNSIKYKKQDKQLKLEIYAQKGKENISLYINDNGIGIKSGELEKVFEKGFTGTNGRYSNKKSTGIGLYLCKKLCDKLGIAININSVENEGTEINLVFPKATYTDIL